MSKRYYKSKLHILQEGQKLIPNRDIKADSTEWRRAGAGDLAGRTRAALILDSREVLRSECFVGLVVTEGESSQGFTSVLQ